MCPTPFNRPDEPLCAWPDTLAMVIGPIGGTFFQSWELAGDSTIVLPGELRHWPQAVEVNGVHYWDRGYMGNPLLYPFFKRSASQDILVVQINPVYRPGAPRSAPEILQRVNEITFNSSLLKEFRAINFVDQLLEEGRLDPEKYRSIYLHLITSNDELKELGASSKLNSEWAFLKHLFDLGRDAAGEWLDNHYDKLGVESTINPLAVIQGLSRV